MLTFTEYINESDEKVLTIFDLDDTLFHTFAMIRVIKNGVIIKSITNKEFNVYKLDQGESYDFSEFESSKIFKESSKVIDKMMNMAKIILANTLKKSNNKMIILTARSDFDDKDMFLRTLHDHGLDVNNVYIERSGNLKSNSSAVAKVITIKKYLDKYKFTKVRMFDDAISNLEALKNMKNDYPSVKFFPYLVSHNGLIKLIK